MRRTLFALLLLLPACGGGSSGIVPVLPGKAVIPDFPFIEADSISVDPDLLEAEATRHCTLRRRADAVLFMLEDLPLGATDALCAAGFAAGGASASAEAAPPAWFGNLYLSGYYGGLWLRDSIRPETQDAFRTLLAPPARKAAQDPTPLEEFVLRALADLAQTGIDRSRTEDEAALIASARESLPLLLALFGYNRGYLEATIERPPPGVPAPFDPLVCDGLLDCSRPGVSLATLDRFSSALAKLAAPPNARWREIADLAAETIEPAIPVGRGVWERILADQEIDAAAYGALLEVSAGYLLVTEAAILAAASAYADEAPTDGRCGALTSSGLLLWSGSYFLGLASAAPEGTFPEVTCGG